MQQRRRVRPLQSSAGSNRRLPDLLQSSRMHAAMLWMEVMTRTISQPFFRILLLWMQRTFLLWLHQTFRRAMHPEVLLQSTPVLKTTHK